MRSTGKQLFLVLAMLLALALPSGGTAVAAGTTPTLSTAIARISPAPDQVVGIAHPVIIEFAAPVRKRANAERAVTVTSGQRLAGSFSWRGNRELTWTPTGFLPANAPITVSIGSQRTQFNTNVGVVADANMSAHTFTVSIGGVVVRNMVASMGKPGWETPVGTYPILEKFRYITFDSRTIGIPLDSAEGYLINGEYAERLTWGGVFVHSAPWSTDQQGNSNVSHGCINLAPGDAAWYYETANVGDPVNIHW